MIQAFADEKLDKELTALVQARNLQMRSPGGQPPMRPGGQPPMQPGGQPPLENGPNQSSNVQQAMSLVLSKLDKGFQEKNAEALSKIGRGAVPALKTNLLNNSTLIRWGCIKALGMMGPAGKDAANQLVLNTRLEQIPELKQDATSALQKVMKR
jgi:hypothetical protein